MCEIGPPLTTDELRKSAEQTIKGQGREVGLPGVESDAERMDKGASKINREMASRISAAVAQLKPSDGSIPRFVLGWRLYPNRESPFWHGTDGKHACGCGCGCFSQPPGPR